MAGGATGDGSPRRRIAFGLAVALLGGVALETFSWAALSIVEGRPVSREALAAEQLRRSAGERGAAVLGAGAPGPGTHVLHPYLGYVMDPAPLRRAAARLGIDPLSLELGFPRNQRPVLQAADPAKLVVGMFGGSVADVFAAAGAPALRAALAPALRGRELVLLSLGAPGYKQPQQLTTLAYLLALGAHFDVVVNLDGVNDVALPSIELTPLGVAPFYPRGWFARASELRPELRLAIGRIALYEDLRARAAAIALSRPWRWSFTAALLWRVTDRFASARIAAGEAALLAAPGTGRDDQARGPELPGFAGDDAYPAIAGLWMRSSLQMHRLCSGLGIAYYHALQPNQYVPGSKPMGDAERRVAFREDSPFRVPIERGYPLLRQAGGELAASGVPFVDLTDLFSAVSEPVYADDCCHLDARGNELLAAALARVIAGGAQGTGAPEP
jgi:hypothetical protein